MLNITKQRSLLTYISIVSVSCSLILTACSSDPSATQVSDTLQAVVGTPSASSSQTQPATPRAVGTAVTTATTAFATVSPVAITPGVKTASPTPVKTANPTPTSSRLLKPLASYTDWEYRWLEGGPCSAPCWEGIRPGITTADQAKATLLKLAFVTNVQEQSVTPYSPHELNWNWTEGNGGPTIHFTTNSPTEVVDSITLILPKSFRLGDINRIYGEPNYIQTSVDYRDDKSIYSYNIAILYQDKGILLYDGFEKRLAIDANTPFRGVILIRPVTIEEVAKKTNLFNPKNTPQWQGYKDFSFYCTPDGTCA